MLLELVIENYAVIDRLRVAFHEGLNVLTGETGSGKSIVVDALGLLFGGRASAEMVRSGEERARISGIFEASDSGALAALMESAGMAAEDGELLLEREILASGKSRAFAGGRPVTAAVLRDLAPLLGDIHGQHEQQRLFSAGEQLEMLDSFAGHAGLLSETGGIYTRWQATAAELEQLDRAEQEKLRLLDLWTFQRAEIESAAIRAGEDAELEGARRILQNVTRLEEAASAAYMALYDAPDSAAAKIRAALKKIEEGGRVDGALGEMAAALQPAAIAVDEASHALRHYLGKLEADPGRLEEVENRLAALDRLKRKYGATLGEILAFHERVKQDLDSAESAEQRRAELRKERAALGAKYEAVAGALRASREEAARRLEQRVEAELRPLAMERAVFRIESRPAIWSASGFDSVAFLISANAGEAPKALDRIASGGELSRVALALKTCVIEEPRVSRTLVFDEVDAGIGGAAAEAVGRRLKRLSDAHQVLCVTHLAQIAGFAAHHFAVSKREVAGRTVAAIEELEGESRTREMGRMLSGRVTPEALRHAAQLLELGAEP